MAGNCWVWVDGDTGEGYTAEEWRIHEQAVVDNPCYKALQQLYWRELATTNELEEEVKNYKNAVRVAKAMAPAPPSRRPWWRFW